VWVGGWHLSTNAVLKVIDLPGKSIDDNINTNNCPCPDCLADTVIDGTVIVIVTMNEIDINK